MTKKKRQYFNKVFTAVIALVAALIGVGAATFAWYIYNTNAHTTNVKMAAGTVSSLLISDTYDGEYGYSAAMVPYVGELTPVSTDKILNGFQEVKDFKKGGEGEPALIANIFQVAPRTDFFTRSLFLKSTSNDLKVYVKSIGYKDTSDTYPISTCIRVGLVVYKPGDQNTIDKEYIFEINPTQHIIKPEYNTEKGEAGHVLDSTKTDGSTVKFDALTPDNYCKIDANGGVEVTGSSQQICTCPGDGQPVRVEMYIWLEGCDIDCTGNLGSLSEITIEFAGVQSES